MTSPPCAYVGVRIPCVDCNRHFRSQSYYHNYKKQRLGADRKGKTVCEQKNCCGKCGAFITEKKHDYNKRWCDNCGVNKEIGHLCFMRPLLNKLPASDKVIFVFYGFETTQDTKYSDSDTVHVPNLVCLQQFCSKCENIQDINIDCEQCVRRKHKFWDDPVGQLLTYLCKSRLWCSKIVAIAHNAKAFDLQFILNRAIFLKWKPKLIVNGLKIICMTMEHLTFIYSISCMPCSLRKLSEAFGLTAAKSWYPHYFYTNENMNYVGEIPDVSYYGADAMSAKGRAEFLSWYEGQRSEGFDNRNALEPYCQDDLTVLRQVCIFQRRVYRDWQC